PYRRTAPACRYRILRSQLFRRVPQRRNCFPAQDFISALPRDPGSQVKHLSSGSFVPCLQRGELGPTPTGRSALRQTTMVVAHTRDGELKRKSRRGRANLSETSDHLLPSHKVV